MNDLQDPLMKLKKEGCDCNMTRAEMLEKLSELRFTVYWGGVDVGITERPIWVNSQGYGYYYCDEPCSFAVMNNIPADAIDAIARLLEKYEEGTLFDDDESEAIDWDDEDAINAHLVGQIIVRLNITAMNELIIQDRYGPDEDEYILCFFRDLCRHTATRGYFSGDCIYCGLTDNAWEFFESEDALLDYFNKNTGYEGGCWEDMNDESLAAWIADIAEADLVLPMTLSTYKE